jgi:hypothetical protein
MQVGERRIDPQWKWRRWEQLMVEGIALSHGLSSCRKDAGEEEEQGMVVVTLMGSLACVNMRAGEEEERRSACDRRATVRESVVRWESGSFNGGGALNC